MVRTQIVSEMMESLRHDPAYLYGLLSVSECSACVAWIAHPGSMAATPVLGDANGISCLLSGECWTADAVGTTICGGAAVVNAYLSKADSFVGELEGLFSGVLLDPRRRRVLLFNDRYSSERLYVFEKSGVTYFASEAKALLRVLPELRQWDTEGVAQFLKYGSTHGGRTLFRGLHCLSGASVWNFDRGTVRRGRYFEPSQWEELEPLGTSDFEGQLCDRFPRLLQKYLRSDADVGISITGGLDTRMIMSCLPPGGVDGACYTYVGLEGLTADARIGAQVARSCGMRHEVLRVQEEFLTDFANYVDRTVHLTDGCAGPLQAHEIHLSRLAAQLSRIRITGNYGSEVLRSMSTLKPDWLSADVLSPDMRRLVEQVAIEWPLDPMTKAVFAEVPCHLFGTLAAARTELAVRTPYLDSALVRLAYQAPSQARESSSSACQVISQGNPSLARIRTDQGLKPAGIDLLGTIHRVLALVSFKLDYWHKEGLPNALTAIAPTLDNLASVGLLGQHKYLPYRSWFAGPMRDAIEAMLADSSVREAPFWDRRTVDSVQEEHRSGRINRVREIHAILLLGAVERTLMRHASRAKSSLTEGVAMHSGSGIDRRARND